MHGSKRPEMKKIINTSNINVNRLISNNPVRDNLKKVSDGKPGLAQLVERRTVEGIHGNRKTAVIRRSLVQIRKPGLLTCLNSTL